MVSTIDISSRLDLLAEHLTAFRVFGKPFEHASLARLLAADPAPGRFRESRRESRTVGERVSSMTLERHNQHAFTRFLGLLGYREQASSSGGMTPRVQAGG